MSFSRNKLCAILQPSLYAFVKFLMLLDGFGAKQRFGNIKESLR